MKTYVCDACNVIVDDPHEMKMKEFYVGCSFELSGVFPNPTKRKVKVHLCDDCFRSLCTIAQKKSEVKHD